MKSIKTLIVSLIFLMIPFAVLANNQGCPSLAGTVWVADLISKDGQVTPPF